MFIPIGGTLHYPYHVWVYHGGIGFMGRMVRCHLMASVTPESGAVWQKSGYVGTLVPISGMIPYLHARARYPVRYEHRIQGTIPASPGTPSYRCHPGLPGYVGTLGASPSDIPHQNTLIVSPGTYLP